MLIREIAAGRLSEGERLPPERDMAAGLGIAVGTLRKALAELNAKGLLERVQGSGNYVRSRPDVASIYALFRLELVEGGGLPTARLLSVERLQKPADLPPFGTSPEAHRIRRLRLLNDGPAAVEEIWLDGSRAPLLRAEDLSESLYLFYRRALNFSIARVEDRVGVGLVPDWSPAQFGQAPGTTVGLVERIGWDGEGARAEFSRSWFDHHLARYVARHR